jgi:signal transduction histidine kinase
VADNGSGFLQKDKTDSYGVANMQQRAADSGFVLNIETNEKGTTIELKENTANAALGEKV